MDPTPSPLEELSPAVRRLVRQFDLDITGIHGTGPEGRIRVGDVMGLLEGRKDSGNRDAPARSVAPQPDETPLDTAVAAVEVEVETDVDVEAEPATPLPLTAPEATAAPAPRSAIPTTSVFECDLSLVLADRKRRRDDMTELLTTSYVLTALASAIEATPELLTGQPPRFGVWLTAPDGEARPSLVDLPDPLPATFEKRVRAFDSALRVNLGTDVTEASLLVHAYADSGSLLAAPTPIGAGHAASIGIGRVRRELVVRVINGVETARAAARCYLSISFFDDRVPFHRANRALADTVRILENWPE
jgi:pyruvate/2-oxoglutarate dehydrogenase complex dihydrolipoamide acyltransferase (E2) component